MNTIKPILTLCVIINIAKCSITDVNLLTSVNLLSKDQQTALDKIDMSQDQFWALIGSYLIANREGPWAPLASQEAKKHSDITGVQLTKEQEEKLGWVTLDLTQLAKLKVLVFPAFASGEELEFETALKNVDLAKSQKVALEAVKLAYDQKHVLKTVVLTEADWYLSDDQIYALVAVFMMETSLSFVDLPIVGLSDDQKMHLKAVNLTEAQRTYLQEWWKPQATGWEVGFKAALLEATASKANLSKAQRETLKKVKLDENQQAALKAGLQAMVESKLD